MGRKHRTPCLRTQVFQVFADTCQNLKHSDCGYPGVLNLMAQEGFARKCETSAMLDFCVATLAQSLF